MGEIRVRDLVESDAGALARLLHEFNGMKTTAEPRAPRDRAAGTS